VAMGNAVSLAAYAGTVQSALAGLPFRSESVRELDQEVAQIGKDMFVSLAGENIKVYMVGGMLVALAGVLAIFIANFIEERRTFALLRIRGGTPSQHLRLSVSSTFGPVLLGAVLGLLTGLPAGYGLATEIFRLSGSLFGIEALPVHLIVSSSAFMGAVILILFFAAVSLAFSAVVFRRTAREGLTS
jgi:hypothetical protein